MLCIGNFYGFVQKRFHFIIFFMSLVSVSKMNEILLRLEIMKILTTYIFVKIYDEKKTVIVLFPFLFLVFIALVVKPSSSFFFLCLFVSHIKGKKKTTSSITVKPTLHDGSKILIVRKFNVIADCRKEKM